MKKHTISELNELYAESESCDKDLRAEQRSNVLLVAGEHYSKRGSRFWNRVRESRDLNNEQKIRLTKNHLQRISKLWINHLVSESPGVTALPRNEKELQDIKCAELNRAVINYGKDKMHDKMTILREAQDFWDIGEVACKVFFDPMAGRFIGYEQEVDSESGEAQFNEDGSPVSSGRPVFTGDVVSKRLYGYNLLRSANARTMEESHYILNLEMMECDDLEEMVRSSFSGDELTDKLKFVTETKDDTFFVFDSNIKDMLKVKNQTCLREWYFRPCALYPQGYFYIGTSSGIIWEGELPFGLFPIIFKGFDEVQSSPRCRSLIKQLRPYQVEVNRAASKIAEHQITLGDDKLLVQSGTKLTQGSQYPGIRSYQFSGMPPQILPGRSGDQYFEYAQSQIQEMYQVGMVEEALSDKDTQADPFGQLFKNLKQKKKFTIYVQKFHAYQVEKWTLYLKLMKEYATPEMLIPAIGRNEMINIDEFKTAEPMSFSIRVEESDDDLESMMGKQLTLNHFLQYSSSSLSKEDIGRVMRNMPFANAEDSFSDLTLNYDVATNMILALDRGEAPIPYKYDDKEYMLKRLTSRTRLADFQQLTPDIQTNYDNMIALYEQFKAEEAAELKKLQDEFIPSGGARIKVDYYVPDPTNASRTVRATLPAESIDWLIKRLDDQGSAQAQLRGINQGAVQEIAQKFLAQGPGTGPAPNNMPMGMGGGVA